jgi:hypothetical protein
MAFCPECGKAVAPESASCANCGFTLPKPETKTAGARFKGTVMMTAPVAGTSPANANANKPAPAAEHKIAVNAAASAVAQPKAASGGRGSAKATMIGAGVPAEMIAAAQASAAKLAANPPIARAGAHDDRKLTAVGVAPAQSAGAQHRNVPQAAETKRSAPPSNAVATKTEIAHSKELGAPAAPLQAAAQTKELGSALPEMHDDAAALHPKPAAPLKPPVSATANTDAPPPRAAAPSVRAMKNVPISQPPEAQFAATQAALPGPPPRPTHAQRHEPSIVVDAEAEVVATPAEQAQPRYLPGDPMAPQHATPLRLNAPRTTLPGDEALTIPHEERMWLYWAVCGTVVLVVVLLAFGLFR